MNDNVYSHTKKNSGQGPLTSTTVKPVWRRRTGPSVDAYTRHKQLINNYILFHKGSTNIFKRDTSRDKNDYDVIRENHRFLWENTDDSELIWEQRLAKRYYDKLFKEYCFTDLSRYLENKVGLRWRTEAEVRSGKGQFVCAEKRCTNNSDLESWEVNFAYKEDGIKKNALVKVRLCPECSKKLNYHSQKRKAVKKVKPKSKKMRKRARSESDDDDSQTAEPANKQIKVEPPDEDDAKPTNSATETDRTETGGTDIWSKPKIVIDEETAREEALDDFLDDLLL